MTRTPEQCAMYARIKRAASDYTADQIQHVRDLLARGHRQTDISRWTGVRIDTVRGIACGRIWRIVP